MNWWQYKYSLLLFNVQQIYNPKVKWLDCQETPCLTSLCITIISFILCLSVSHSNHNFSHERAFAYNVPCSLITPLHYLDYLNYYIKCTGHTFVTIFWFFKNAHNCWWVWKLPCEKVKLIQKFKTPQTFLFIFYIHKLQIFACTSRVHSPLCQINSS